MVVHIPEDELSTSVSTARSHSDFRGCLFTEAPGSAVVCLKIKIPLQDPQSRWLIIIDHGSLKALKWSMSKESQHKIEKDVLEQNCYPIPYSSLRWLP